MVVKTHHLLALVIVSTPVLVVWGCSNDVDYREPEHGSGAAPPPADQPDPGQAQAEPDPEIRVRLDPTASPEEPAAPAADPTPNAGEPAATATQAETVCEISACIAQCMDQQSLGSCVDGVCVCSEPGKASDGDLADRLPPLDPAFDGMSMPEKPSMPEIDPAVAIRTPEMAEAGIKPIRPMGTSRPSIGTAKPAITVRLPSTGGMPVLDAGVPNTR